MDYFIRLNNILPLQKLKTKFGKAFAIRVFYEDESTDGIGQLSLKITDTLITPSLYKPFTIDIMKDIINEILHNCINYSSTDITKNSLFEIVHCSTQIAISTRRGPGNFAIFSEKESEDFFKNNQYMVNGMINGTIKAFISPYLEKGIIVGYCQYFKNHNVHMDGGLVLSLLEDTYQIVNVKGSEKYYRYIERE